MNNIPDTTLPKTLYPSRTKNIIYLIISLILLVICIATLKTQKATYWTIFSTIFFSISVIIFILALIPGSSYLRLTQEGLEIKNLFRSNAIKWTQIKQFYVLDLGIKKMIALEFSANDTQANLDLSIPNKSKVKAPAALPNTYGMNAEELADLLNALLKQN